MRDPSEDWATPGLRDAARMRNRRMTPRMPEPENLLSAREKRIGKGCLTAFAGAWLVSLLVSLAILTLVVWGLISLISYLNRH